jgi:hypothetical protein
MPFTTPMYIVGEEQAQMWREDPTNPMLMDRATVVESLEKGVAIACEKGQTDKLIVFDGSYGHLTCNKALADLLKERAPAVDKMVAEELLPKWLAQRGLS